MAGIIFTTALDDFDKALAGASSAQTKIGNVKKHGRAAVVNAVSRTGNPAEIIELAKHGVNLRRMSGAGDESAKDVTGAAGSSAVSALYRHFGMLPKETSPAPTNPTILPDGQE